ncbi:MAG TPA: response regulator [Bacteroidia bacterium]|nr:response regulator [Bacteroidia bacterium]
MTKKINFVLFIDDDMMSNVNSKRILEKTNVAFEIIHTESGIEALDLLKTKFIPAGKFPDLIFLDIYMPRFNGWQVLEYLKTLGGEQHNTKIIMLSSSDDEADRERANRIPEVSGYRIKPLTEEYILELTHNMLTEH